MTVRIKVKLLRRRGLWVAQFQRDNGRWKRAYGRWGSAAAASNAAAREAANGVPRGWKEQ